MPDDINSHIRRWRRNLEQHNVLTRHEIDELESHLRDAIAAELRQGQTELAAFQIAAEQLGETTRLATEYRKTRASKRRWSWSPLNVLHLTIAMGNVTLIGALLVIPFTAVAVVAPGFVWGGTRSVMSAQGSWPIDVIEVALMLLIPMTMLSLLVYGRASVYLAGLLGVLLHAFAGLMIWANLFDSPASPSNAKFIFKFTAAAIGLAALAGTGLFVQAVVIHRLNHRQVGM
ncbi:MAG: hypothetical protein AAGE65_02975 [Planctomycetota bacterium]